MTALAYSTAPAHPQPLDLDIPSWEQLTRIGFDSYRSYQVWCVNSGLADEGDEDAIRALLDRQLAEPPQRRPITEERRQLLSRFAAGKVSGRNAHLAEWFKEDEEAQQACRRLFLHVEGFMEVLGSKAICRGVRYRHLRYGLVALACHHRRWLRPPEEWSCVLPKSGHPRRVDQFFTLACHLLARYQTPGAMCSAWFQGIDAQGLQEQERFMHIANGGSIRDLDTPIKLTRRMSHVFQQAPFLSSVEKSLRWSQVMGMGGNRHLAGAVLKTRLGRHFDNDEFWSGVVLFLVNNAMMDPTWVGPVVDYVHNMKFAPRRIVQEGGGVEDGPPPQPNFTMKGRSANKILRQVEAWHGQLSREDFVDFQSWQASGIRPWELADETEELGKVRWTVQELLSSWELVAEGRAMSHCVVSYSNQCADGNTAIWSICAHREGVEEREHVLTVALDVGARAVTQARGRYNAVPNKRQKTTQVQRLEEGGYIRLLDRSEHVMKEWMQRERLRRDD